MVLLALTGLTLAAAAPKVIPPPGIKVPAGTRAALTASAAKLHDEIQAAHASPDIEALWKSVDWALRYNEFFKPAEIAAAKKILERAESALQAAPAEPAKGWLIRGYRSAIDGSVQPYLLLVPEDLDLSKPASLQVWLNGRGETRSELSFITAKPPQLVLPHTLVLVPYGRFCNAYHFAGEQDVFEALHDVQRRYPIDPRRIVLTGFSMGGAGVWHLATHHPDLFCVATPGAGFADVPIYNQPFAPGKPARAAWEPVLWNWYDSIPYVGNLADIKILAYSGEIDPQKQSADLMEAAAKKRGITLERFIGPKTAHKYEPKTLEALKARLEVFQAAGDVEYPKSVDFTTYTLRYANCDWVHLEGLGQQWKEAEVKASWAGDQIQATTHNLTAIRFTLPNAATVVLDGQTQTGQEFHKEGDTWKPGPFTDGLRKVPGLQGPVDDAFMSAFVFVRPTGHSSHPEVDHWVAGELTYAEAMWRRVYRGVAPVIDDTAVTDQDIAAKNLVLWGTPESNAVLAKIAKQLPIAWSRDEIAVGARKFPGATSAPILIYPNPLNPKHYVLLNSGIDFRMEAYGTNALQTPKLPDWAVIDLTTPPGPRWPGKVADAGFFDEAWKLPGTSQ